MGYIDGIHGAPYITAPWILSLPRWDLRRRDPDLHSLQPGGTKYPNYGGAIGYAGSPGDPVVGTGGGDTRPGKPFQKTMEHHHV